MGLCPEHGWYDDSTSTLAGCPQPTHTYPPVVAVAATISHHDERECGLCRALNEAKAAHYALLAPSITLRGLPS